MTCLYDSSVVARANDGPVPILRRYTLKQGARPPAFEFSSGIRVGPPVRSWGTACSRLGAPAMTGKRRRILQKRGAKSFLLAEKLSSRPEFDPAREVAFPKVRPNGHNDCGGLPVVARQFLRARHEVVRPGGPDAPHRLIGVATGDDAAAIHAGTSNGRLGRRASHDVRLVRGRGADVPVRSGGINDPRRNQQDASEGRCRTRLEAGILGTEIVDAFSRHQRAPNGSSSLRHGELARSLAPAVPLAAGRSEMLFGAR